MHVHIPRCCCHESGCHSPQLHITLGLHLPSCTAHTHSRPPLHQSHSCHHSLINPDCLTTPAPHSLTHKKQHTNTHPVRSLVSPWLHFRAYFPVCLSVHYLDCWPPLLIVCCLPLWPRLFHGNPLCLPPALTHCSASVFDSAFSTLPSIPLPDICLFWPCTNKAASGSTLASDLSFVTDVTLAVY